MAAGCICLFFAIFLFTSFGATSASQAPGSKGNIVQTGLLKCFAAVTKSVFVLPHRRATALSRYCVSSRCPPRYPPCDLSRPGKDIKKKLFDHLPSHTGSKPDFADLIDKESVSVSFLIKHSGVTKDQKNTTGHTLRNYFKTLQGESWAKPMFDLFIDGLVKFGQYDSIASSDDLEPVILGKASYFFLSEHSAVLENNKNYVRSTVVYHRSNLEVRKISKPCQQNPSET